MELALGESIRGSVGGHEMRWTCAESAQRCGRSAAASCPDQWVETRAHDDGKGSQSHSACSTHLAVEHDHTRQSESVSMAADVKGGMIQRKA